MRDNSQPPEGKSPGSDIHPSRIPLLPGLGPALAATLILTGFALFIPTRSGFSQFSPAGHALYAAAATGSCSASALVTGVFLARITLAARKPKQVQTWAVRAMRASIIILTSTTLLLLSVAFRLGD